MKIIQICPMINLGIYDGPRTHTLGIAKNMVSLGHKVHLIVSGKENDFNKDGLIISIPKFTNPIGLKGHFLIFLNTINNNLKQYSFLKTLKDYDIIYERFLAFSFSSLLFSKVKGVPLIYEINGIPDEELFGIFSLKNRFLKWIVTSTIKFQLKNSNRVIVTTKELKKIMQRKFNLNNIEVVPVGTDIYKLPIKKRSPIFKMCYIGALDDRHNLDQVFDSISSLKEKFIFFIVGDGNLFNKYNSIYGVDKRFIFKGQLPHKEALNIVNQSDLGIASNSNKYSLYKKYGFYLAPFKLLEYSMLSKPTILFEASNSFTKIFEENKSCFIVNSQKDIIEKLKFLIKNPKLAEKMGENGRNLVEKEFTWMKSAEKTEAIFKKVLKEHNKHLKR